MKSRKIVIRNAHSVEIEVVSQLLREAYLEYEKSFPADAWESYLENMMDVFSRLEEAELIVAELDGQLVGTVTLYMKKSYSEVWPEGWAGVRLVGVHPSYRGQGIGRALMEECIRRCREKGIATIGLHTGQNMHIARAMYEKMGFVRAPEFDFHPGPDTVVMAYCLRLYRLTTDSSGGTDITRAIECIRPQP